MSMSYPQRLTVVHVHAGTYLAHDLMSAMPLVCTGTRVGIVGEALWERTALALQRVHSGGPYPQSEALTVFVHDEGQLTMRFDIEVVYGVAVMDLMRDGVHVIRHAPIAVDERDDVVAIARKVFAAGLP